MVRDLHVAGRTGRFGLLVLAEHAVAVRDSRAVPVVPDPDVLHHHPVHGVEPCDRGRAGIAVAADDSDGEAEVAAVPAGLNKYYRLNIDLMVDILWIVAIVVLIIVTEGAALFAA